MNSRLDELQASVLRVKLKYLDMENEKRREIARMYDNTLNKSILNIPSESKDVKHVYHLYVVRSTKRNELRDFLNKKGIGTAIHYPLPVHLQPAYKNKFNKIDCLPNTERVCKEILSLPIYQELPLDKVEFISDSINQWVSLNG